MAVSEEFKRMVNAGVIKSSEKPQSLFDRIINGPRYVNGHPVIGLVSPLGLGRGVGIAKSIFSGVKNVATRAVASPFAGVSVPQGLKNIGGRALGALTFVEAARLAKSGITHTPFNPIPSATGVKDIAAVGLNPIGTVFGTLQGFGTTAIKTGVQTGKDIFGIGTDVKNSLPQLLPSQPDIYNKIKDLVTPQNNFYLNTPSLPDASFTSPQGSFAPSFSVGSPGIGGDILPLLLALGGGAGLGYLIGHRKKKKKRYKKRRKH